MIDQGLRTAILSLRAKGHGIRQIARTLQISRGTVWTVLHAGVPTVPRIERAEKAEPYRDHILELVDRCRGNLVRVHEELVAQGVTIAYPTLTAFCRRHVIGHEPPAPVGHYDFAPAQEMQHDTSPHRATISGMEQRIETASVVLCYSRMLFFQAYPVFTRFSCKVFLSDALEYLGGAAATCMIDNTHVVTGWEQKGWLKAEWKSSETRREAKVYSLTRSGRKQLGVEKASWMRLAGAVGLIFSERNRT